MLLTTASAQIPQPDYLPLSALMLELSKDPKARDEILRRLDLNPGTGLIGAGQFKHLRELILGKDWRKVDRFPGVTVPGLGRAVGLASLAADKKVDPWPEQAPPSEKFQLPWIDPGWRPEDLVKPLGLGVEWGDMPHPRLAAWHGNSKRLADVLNRLAIYQGQYSVETSAGPVQKAEDLVRVLTQSGYSIEIRDARYFANFGDLRYNNRDVMTAFWIDTGIRVPDTKKTLWVPVGHSQLEIWVDGPQQAVVAVYFGIDGKAEFRPNDTRDQDWVLGRTAYVYRDAQALEVVRAAAAIVKAYAEVQRRNTDLNFGGYFQLGVCNDVNAMIEQHMHGKTTLYPLTLKASFFEGTGEVEQWANALPVDTTGKAPDFERVRGSIPIAPLLRLPYDEMRDDLLKVESAWQAGTLETRFRLPWKWWIGGILGAGLLANLLWYWLRHGKAN